jgi:hypothetical protein
MLVTVHAKAPTASVYPSLGPYFLGMPPWFAAQCTRRSCGSEMSPTWYVTVEVRPGALPRPRSPRLTSTFETEAEAKNFARTKLREGRMVFAGTINPFTPRRTVPSHDLAAWVADKQEHSTDLENRGSISDSQT